MWTLARPLAGKPPNLSARSPAGNLPDLWTSPPASAVSNLSLWFRTRY